MFTDLISFIMKVGNKCLKFTWILGEKISPHEISPDFHVIFTGIHFFTTFHMKREFNLNFMWRHFVCVTLHIKYNNNQYHKWHTLVAGIITLFLWVFGNWYRMHSFKQEHCKVVVDIFCLDKKSTHFNYPET